MNDDIIEIYTDFIDDEGYVQRYNYDKKQYYNTGTCLKGSPGRPGRPGKDGTSWDLRDIDGVFYWFKNGVNTQIPAQTQGSNQNLATVATTGDYNDLANKPTIPTKTSDLSNDSNYMNGLTILSYGNSTWTNFINAYSNNQVVYCRASSNTNPATGTQTRLAFMAFVNNADSPTEVEFQYYRSVANHSDNQQGDQVFVYKLTNSNVWTVTTREASSKIVAGNGLTSSYASGTLTLSSNIWIGTQSEYDNISTKDASTIYIIK